MRLYAIWDNVLNDMWTIYGIGMTTPSPDVIAFYWVDLEHAEPGRYEIFSADVDVADE